MNNLFDKNESCWEWKLYQTMNMKKFIYVMIAGLLILLTGCEGSGVKYSDICPAPTAFVSGDSLIINVGILRNAKNSWARLEMKVEGEKVCIYGYRTSEKQVSDFTFKLPASVNPQTVPVVWVNPGGTHITVRVSR
jgi:hypothetical protein